MDFDEFETGMGTTCGMWQMVSNLLDGQLLTESLNEVLHALCEGRAKVIMNEEIYEVN